MKELAQVLEDKAKSQVESSTPNTPILVAAGVGLMAWFPQMPLTLAELNYVCCWSRPTVYWVKSLGQLRSLKSASLPPGRVFLCAIEETDDDVLAALNSILEAEQAWLKTDHKKFDSDGYLIEKGTSWN